MMASWLCWGAWVVTCVVPILLPPACPSPLNDSILAPAHHNTSNIIPQDVSAISNGHQLRNDNTSNIIPLDTYAISNGHLLKNSNTSNIIPLDTYAISNGHLLGNDNTSNIIHQDFITNEQLQSNIDSAHKGFTKSAMLEVSTSVVNDATDQISNIVNVFAIVKDVVNLVEITLSVPPIVSSIIGIFTSILSFTMVPSANSVMREEFKVVNQKLDAITLQLRNIKGEMQVNTEFQAWMSTYIHWEYAIRNGESKLVDTLEIIQTARDERIRLKAAKGFVDYFREQDIEGAIRNVLRISTTGSNSVTAPNLLELYGTQTKCDIKGLSLLMLTLMELTISATKQQYMYSLLIYESQDLVDQQVIKINNQVYHTQQYYKKNVYSCFDNTINNAKILTEDILTEHYELEGYALTEYLHTQISKSAPWYKWAVAQYEEISTVCLKVDDQDPGYFTCGRNGRKVLVMWQDPSDEVQECDGVVKLAQNVIPYEPCDGCDGYIKFDDTFLTKHNCKNYLNMYLYNKGQCWYQTSFVASGFKPIVNICNSNTCNGHGECIQIPYTNKYMCFCEPFYSGRDCAQKFDPTTIKIAADVLDKMRNHLGQYIGVPDDVDIFLALRSFSDQLAKTQTSIISSVKYHQILTSYGQEFDEAEYIAEKYINLINGNITEKHFIYHVQKKDFHFDHFFYNLQKAICGSGVFLTYDLLYYYKLSLNQFDPCTEDYNRKIETFMKNILKFDEIVSEAQITLILGLSKTQDIMNLHETIEHLGTAASQRQARYKQHWQQESCPPLPSLSSCGSYTYEGLNVTITCPSDSHPVPEIITCQRNNGSLEWSATPKCVKYEWGPWSTCSKTCGGGQQTRARTKPHHNPERESRTCNEIDCCHSSFNKTRCSNNKCIDSYRVCDGNNDCGDGDDESRCYYLQSGYSIALKNLGMDNWMSGNGKGIYKSYFQLSTCPITAKSLEGIICRNKIIMSKIVARGRRTGEAIRYGDKVAIMFKSSQWVSHYKNKWVKYDDCPGYGMDSSDWQRCKYEMWTIFSLASKGSCDGNVHSNCIGQPIQREDTVFFLGDASDTFMSASEWKSKYWVSESKCPGYYINSNSSSNCRNEQWILAF